MLTRAALMLFAVLLAGCSGQVPRLPISSGPVTGGQVVECILSVSGFDDLDAHGNPDKGGVDGLSMRSTGSVVVGDDDDVRASEHARVLWPPLPGTARVACRDTASFFYGEHVLLAFDDVNPPASGDGGNHLR